jgi:transcriptional regulator with XRE-family HTH domain
MVKGFIEFSNEDRQHRERFRDSLLGPYDEVMQSSELGEFLRASRAKIDPADVGLPLVGVRRVAGLRREEVAALAGISSDYYTRLEQGRERSPSSQVIHAIARSLRLDPDGREHLLRLAGVIPLGRMAMSEIVDPALRQLLDSLHGVAAYVMNRNLDVLATNALAAALFAPMRPIDNMARMVLTRPAARTRLGNWRLSAEHVVHSLRLAEGYDPDDPSLRSLIADLRTECPDFWELWQTNTARGLTQLINSMVADEVGVVEYTSLAFDVRRSLGLQLVIVFAEPSSTSARSFVLLEAAISNSAD